MKLTPRQLFVVILAGGLAAIAVIAVASAMQPRGLVTDGSFELTRPGEFVEPTGSTNPVIEGAALPSAGLEDADGRPADLSIFRGGPLVINVWYSTCAPCATELRTFGDAHRSHADSVAFVGIDPFDGVAAMQRFADERDVDYDLWRDPDHTFVNALGIVAYPTTLFVDGNGEIVKQTGVLSADALEEALVESFPEIAAP